MKMRRDFYNSGFTCAVVWLSLACLLFILSLATMITAKPTINEIDMISNATNETYPPIMCPIMTCRWGFSHEIDEVTGCQTCWDPCSNVECPENKTCVLQMRACFTTPCPPLTTCENITF
ncbi:PREDICTED: uncharacterized protein LOC108745878 [Trachymyrmex septentrionalis]|uniref:uncharacterized protein LOC108745878 n=1 Tax=Trachymyrmex septentrionalis TaxID=34720 RepID=UPI00084F3A02|nr:PREDICTED: uncharacterized protein LOC108745878 [Trachymyrmex septentrionalis]XP_018337790.1 PREDICTED: uncharacterized protein LOC108745878 [Trachymyrmex septentrionalis]